MRSEKRKKLNTILKSKQFNLTTYSFWLQRLEHTPKKVYTHKIGCESVKYYDI